MRPVAINPVKYFAGTDPGRLRLVNATCVALAVLLSTCAAFVLVHLTHADTGFLSVGAFLALQTGLVVKDSTAPQRLVTMAILLIPASLGISVATLLDRHRPVEIAVFVVIGGIATWLRKFGPRWSAVGMLAFFSYFFALFLRPTVDEIPLLIGIACIAVLSNLVIRLAIIKNRPGKELALLRRQFLGACRTALATAAGPAVDGTALQSRIDRIGAVAGGVHDWQDHYDTQARTGLSAERLSYLLFDARTDLVQACLQLSRLRVEQPHGPLPPSTAALVSTLDALLTPNPRVDRPAAVEAEPTSSSTDTQVELADSLLARAIDSQRTLGRAFDQPEAFDQPASTAESGATAATTTQEATSDEVHDQAGGSTPTAVAPTGRAGPWSWRDWAPTTRMALQVMVAAALATVAGEAISASRWYWAVLTAFLVFVGTTTRAGILTRAFRRVLGTCLGVVVGMALTIVIDGVTWPLILICVVSVFCVLYFGPLTYAAMAFFVTLLLASMYGLLGILNREILTLRVEETLTGAGIGVACAFLLFSTSSRPDLANRIDGFFDAVDGVLDRSSRALTGSGGTVPVLAATERLDAAAAELRSFTSSMWLSFPMTNRRTLRRSATDLINGALLHSERLAQESLAAVATGGELRGTAATAIESSVERVRAQGRAASDRLLNGPHRTETTSVDEVLDVIGEVPCAPHTPQFRALVALSKLSTALGAIERLPD